MKKLIEFIVDNIIFIIFGFLSVFVYLSMKKRDDQHQEAKKLVDKAIKSGLNEPMTLHPEIDADKCSGCAACTQVCPEGDILKMIDHKAVLVGPAKCVGHGECERACPVEAIKLVFGTKTRGMDIPRLTSNYETNISGLYIAGELGGMGLIRNAIKQGVFAAKDAIKKLPNNKADFDIIIVGAGPAGLAAGMTAISEKKTYLCLEQGSFGGTVYNFPRQKIVMSHPFELPMLGTKKFESNKVSKEQLLAYWQEAKKRTGLKVSEETQFETLEKVGNIFSVKTKKGVFTSKKVILCMGVRGSPRKLGVPGEELPKVTYNLLDPEQYQKKNLIVVGGGNAALEAAQMLGDVRWGNKVHLFVRGDKMERSNEDNILRVTAMQKKGLVQIHFNTSIEQIFPLEVSYQENNQNLKMSNDYVFVFVGAEMPQKFLMSLGVKIDKKFAEGLGT